ncbi:DUF4136 domain-containing protein [Castellaniella sp.]|uniref:DUF4136 domain-containing protein n=1 Tax=Castellaniella sp. TaxID=1955812 RepID=UPI002AFF1B82|nr:DUF4136 domain-containing protein [Castellaniella sp.]
MLSDKGRLLRCWLVFVMMALGGCASVFSAQVTRYQQWPDQTQGARYWVEPDADQQNNLQFQTFADTVRAALGPTGLVEAQSRAQARFIVRMDYGSQQEQEWRQRVVDPYFYGGFPGPGFGYHPYWGAWGPGPVVETVPVVVSRLHLSVRIDDQNQQGREVYRATAVAAVAAGRDQQLGAAMPYLARALFDHFPGRNGQVVRVRYPLE